jgi:hypothetical protein
MCEEQFLVAFWEIFFSREMTRVSTQRLGIGGSYPPGTLSVPLSLNHFWINDDF